MVSQFSFFRDVDDDTSRLEGFGYQPELIEAADEDALVARVRELPFQEFEFHGFRGKRRVVSFGWKYEFSGGGQLRKADEIPEFLLRLRSLAASFARLDADAFQHVLVTEYGPGAGIGWHRDKAVFGQVVGVSLLAPCVLRFRRKMNAKWDRVNVLAERGSGYHLTGPARAEWEHSILRVDALRYSITFRTMREE
ncbi:MAG TPA: alpha-ketoglutarate-dependent dioxygenase AlkB [Pyrinomonadaceae bacterium]|nr:alpha-ketoglutarate-dependent dioxygenase AlkB [Pyrinomonadaceae bacterium]